MNNYPPNIGSILDNKQHLQGISLTNHYPFQVNLNFLNYNIFWNSFPCFYIGNSIMSSLINSN